MKKRKKNVPTMHEDGVAYSKTPWPPQVAKKNSSDHMRPGQPMVLLLTREWGDKAATTSQWLGCCACGFRHLLAYEVFRAVASDDNGEHFWLSIRAYDDPASRPLKVVRSKSKGAKNDSRRRG